jgi:hypothetical protein
LEFLEKNILEKLKKINSSRKELQSISLITQAYNFSIVFDTPSMQNFICALLSTSAVKNNS